MDALLQGYRKETMKLLCKRSAKADNGRFAWRAVVYHSSVADPKNNDVKTVLEAAVDLCSLQSVCQKRRTCASSSFDRLVPCKSFEPHGHPFPGIMMCPQYSLTARRANVPPLVYNCVLGRKQEIQTAKRKETLEACLAKNGLQLRADSRLCSAYIATGQGEPAHIATVMLEMAWLFENTNYANVLQKVCRQTARVPAIPFAVALDKSFAAGKERIARVAVLSQQPGRGL